MFILPLSRTQNFDTSAHLTHFSSFSIVVNLEISLDLDLFYNHRVLFLLVDYSLLLTRSNVLQIISDISDRYTFEQEQFQTRHDSRSLQRLRHAQPFLQLASLLPYDFQYCTAAAEFLISTRDGSDGDDSLAVLTYFSTKIWFKVQTLKF